ncbi:MAG: AMP-binding protein [Parvibaculales bacterium]
MTKKLGKWHGFETPKHHQAFINADIYTNQTLADRARQLAETKADEKIFPNDPQSPTFASILEDAQALAASLCDMGILQGDVVSFQMPNWHEAAVINLACAVAGFVANPIVIIYRHNEVKFMLQDSKAKLFFVSEHFANFDFSQMMDEIAAECPDLKHIAYVRSKKTGNYDELLATGRGLALPNYQTDPNAVKLVLYTSGTTGRPKAVLHSHNTLMNVLDVCAKHWQIQPGDHVLMPSPVTHISGYSNGLELPFAAQTRTVLMEKWNAGDALQLIQQYQVAGTVAATPFLQELTQLAAEQKTALPSLRYFACGGAAVPPDIVYNANQQFGQVCVFRVFGSSEAPLVTLGYQGDMQADLAAETDGEAIDYELRIVDEQEQLVASGIEGEVQVRGPSMLLGYALLEDTKGAVTEDGFFRTGDLGFINDKGALCISGRKKDLIIRGGENISAKEIEDVLHLSPDIAEASVVSIPHKRLGEGVCAFIILKEGSAADTQNILDFVMQSGLAKQKTPEKIIFTQDFPRTASGKIQKNILRDQIKDQMVGG